MAGCDTRPSPGDKEHTSTEVSVQDTVRVCLMCGVAISKEASPDIYTLESFLDAAPMLIVYVHPNGVCRYALSGRAQKLVRGA